MASFTDGPNGQRALTPVKSHWFGPLLTDTDNSTLIFDPFTTNYNNGVGPWSVTLSSIDVDEAGNVVGDPIPIASYTTGANFETAETSLANDEVALFWSSPDPDNPSNAVDINVQAISSTGSAVGSPTILMTGLTNLSSFHAASVASGGQSYVLSYATFDKSTGEEVTSTCAFDANGTPVSDTSTVIDTHTNTNDVAGSFSFSTLESSTAPTPDYLYLRASGNTGAQNAKPELKYVVVGLDGAATSSEESIPISVPSGSQYIDIEDRTFVRLDPAAANGDDLATIVRVSYEDGSGTEHQELDIHTADVSSDGTATDGADQIISVASNGTGLTATRLPDGGFVIGYGDGQNDTGYLQAFGADGKEEGAAFALPTNELGFNLQSTPDGRVLVEWASAESGGNQLNYDIYSVNPPCYCTGTRIDTFGGSTAVESLAIGDLLVTAAGRQRPVEWIGHRRLDLTKHPDPRAVWPVRVTVGAFGEGLPKRDLWMSPGHNVFVNGVLIAIKHLINGVTITQEPVDTVTYWHVELDCHDVILAEGVPAESYLDTGNRTAFENGGAFVEMHPDFEPRHEAETCAPIVKVGPEVEAAKAVLLARAQRLGNRTTPAADLHIMADGRRIEPIDLGGKRFAFYLPAACRAIALTSRAFVPAHVRARSTDDRVLGIAIKQMRIDGELVDLRTMAAPGWHKPEEHPSHVRRWTTGSAALPPGARLVTVDVASEGRYWVEHQENEVALRA